MKVNINKEIFNKLEFPKIRDKIISNCSSNFGIEKANNMEFKTNIFEVDKNLELTVEMLNIITVEGGLKLDGLKDVRKIISNLKIEGYFILQDKLLWIADFLRINRGVKSFIQQRENEFKGKYTGLFKLTQNIFTDKLIEHNIERTIDDSGNIKDNASANLRRIRNEIARKSEQLRKTLGIILKDVSDQEMTRDEIISIRDGRFVIPVRVENKRKVNGIIHSTSSSGMTVFIEPTETIAINNEITELNYEEKREIELILKDISFQLAKYKDELSVNCDIISDVDFINAKAKYAIQINGIKPELCNSLNIIEAYHPILLNQYDRKSIVPLSLDIDDSFNTVVITGPNAGGKTVSLKTIGLLQLMLQCGLLIPCAQYSKFKIFNNIFVSIGDEQSIENNLSSFSSHLKYINEILEDSDEESLVLIDEICSGTDPNSGSALAQAMLDELSERNAISVITTHIGELKSYAYRNKKVRNASLEFDLETISPNYHFKLGIPGQSFTFEIAEKYNIQDKIIKNAKSYQKSDEVNTDELIRELELNIQKYRKLKSESDLENVRLKGLINIYESKVNSIKQKERESIKEAKEKAEQIIKDANKLIERTIKEIRESHNIKPAEIKDKFKRNSNIILDYKNGNVNEIPKIFNIGDKIRIRDSNSEGLIEEISGESVKININGITVKSKLSELSVSDDNRNNYYTKSEKSSPYSEFRKIKTELDIRGQFPEEIELIIGDFINDAIINGLTSIRIIHGKGTGKLRDKVKELLKKNKSIKSYRLGNWNEGDSGVTIIEI